MQSERASKIEYEKRLVEQMVQIYCQGQKHERDEGLCTDCASLLRYAHQRTERCPYMEEKTFCSNCPVQCYRPQMREDIRQVMRYAGPRMMLHHPVVAIRHMVECRREKKDIRKNKTGKRQI